MSTMAERWIERWESLKGLLRHLPNLPDQACPTYPTYPAYPVYPIFPHNHYLGWALGWPGRQQQEVGYLPSKAPCSAHTSAQPTQLTQAGLRVTSMHAGMQRMLER